MGNTAETIPKQFDCALLAIEPADFITPVTLERWARLQTLYVALALFLVLNLGSMGKIDAIVLEIEPHSR